MRVPPLPAFTAASVALHVALAVTLARAPASPEAPAPVQGERPTLAGDTFEIASAALEEEETAPTLEEFPATPESVPEPGPALRVASSPHRPPRPPARSRHAAAGEPRPAAEGAPPPPLFGAVGARDAVDIVAAFSRGFPQAASPDPAWRSIPFGDAGRAEVVLTIDEHGALTASSVSATGPRALRTGVESTLALVRGRTFTARAATTRIVLTAHVSPDQVHDGLHGNTYAVSGAVYDGNAFFALPSGRRIDVRVHVR